MIQVSRIYRHPLKSHGRESLKIVYLSEGQSMPFDRLWAVAHEAARTEGGSWAPCQNFSIGSKAPQLMAINATLDEKTETLTLTHPDLSPLTFHPDRDAAVFLDWVAPLVPANRAQPARVFRLDRRGFTDTEFPSVSLCNAASHAAVEALAGSALSPLRWRGNIWFTGAKPWAEFDWIGRDLRLGNAVLRIEERIERCMATSANPETGQRDVDTLGLLKTQGHRDFGVYARVIENGTVKLDDTLELI
jgi:uncharacterized protein